MTITHIKDVMNLNRRTIAKKLDTYKYLCSIFESDNYTTGEKRAYLYKCHDLSEEEKDVIWNAYIGDNILF